MKWALLAGLFCLAPLDRPVEFLCPIEESVQSIPGIGTYNVRWQPLCPSGYIHQPAISETCRRKDVPPPKWSDSLPDEPVVIKRTWSQRRDQ